MDALAGEGPGVAGQLGKRGHVREGSQQDVQQQPADRGPGLLPLPNGGVPDRPLHRPRRLVQRVGQRRGRGLQVGQLLRLGPDGREQRPQLGDVRPNLRAGHRVPPDRRGRPPAAVPRAASWRLGQGLGRGGAGPDNETQRSTTDFVGLSQ